MTMIVATHKPYWMPEDCSYLPVQAGSHGKESIRDYQRDDQGDNISKKNSGYCELTALYWAWKNLEADWLGLAHYRRHFASGALGYRRSRVADGDQLQGALAATGLVLPKPRNYWIETNYSQYVHAHHEQDLEVTRDVLRAFDPGCLTKYDEVMQRTWGHRFNMFVMTRELSDAWCEWLFCMLSELEARLDTAGYSQNDARVFGFVSERLMDVWVEAGGFDYVEMPVVNMEGQNWPRKGMSFLKRKFMRSS